MTDALPSRIFGYLHDCLQADRRELRLWNLFDRKLGRVIPLCGQDRLLSGSTDRAAVDPAKGEDLAIEAELGRGEKQLVYGAFPIIGRLTIANEKRVLCSPLFIYPATLDVEGSEALLSVDLDERRINRLLLDVLCDDNERSATLHEELIRAVPLTMADDDALATLISVLHAYLPDINTDAATLFPELMSEESVRGSMRAGPQAPGQTLQMLSFGAVALVPRATETRGVLTELDALRSQETLSPPLNMLLTTERTTPPPAGSCEVATGRVPSVLSTAQQHVLARAATRPLSLVIGPPGTGKSYTIAALALDHLSRGESVLVVSRTNRAVDVVGDKLTQMLQDASCLVRGGRRDYLRRLKARLDQLVHGILPDDVPPDQSTASLLRDLARTERQLRRHERAFERRNAGELKRGQRVAAAQRPSLLSRLSLRCLAARVSGRRSYARLADELDALLLQRVDLAATLIRLTNRRRIEKTLDRHRAELTDFLKALRARRGTRREALFDQIDFGVLLEAFPLWLVNLADLHRVLPFTRERFDVVIMDEATQCDMASSLPALQRGKRAVIVGDPKQLRHLSFLSRRSQAALAARHGLHPDAAASWDYREKSILDAASEQLASQQDVSFLDEHFRSQPPIIRFSNREFYANALKIMTRSPLRPETPAIELHHCKRGARDERGINEQELQRVVHDVRALVDAQAHLDAATAQSIGVLSPFRDQIDAIDERLKQVLPPDLRTRHRLLTGTAHSFQGEERDVMFISFALGHKPNASALRYLNRPDQFNVSVTRARTRQICYASLHRTDLNSDTLLARYLAEAEEAADAPSPSDSTVKDLFLSEVRDALVELGCRTWPAYMVAGTVIDLVAEHGGQVRGIDLIGYPGEFENAFSLERYRMFQRAGLHILPLSFVSWRIRRTACLADLRAAMGIERHAAR